MAIYCIRADDEGRRRSLDMDSTSRTTASDRQCARHYRRHDDRAFRDSRTTLAVLLVCLPAAKWVARPVEDKQYTFTIAARSDATIVTPRHNQQPKLIHARRPSPSPKA